MTNSLKRPADGKENLHTMGVMIDMKRRSPTIPDRRNIVEFSRFTSSHFNRMYQNVYIMNIIISAGKFAELLTRVNADAFLVNTDEMEYGGKMSKYFINYYIFN